MNRSDRLQRLSSLVGIDERARARRLEALTAELVSQREQIEVLRRYRTEMAGRLAEGRVGETLTARALQDQQFFLAAVDRAVGQGERRQRQLEAELERLREAWRTVKRRVQGIDQVASRARVDEDRQLRNREQVALDDYPVMKQDG
jgi:flagellar export protein FliJ